MRSMKYEDGSMKGCAVVSSKKKEGEHFNPHNSNFMLAFYSLQLGASAEGTVFPSWSSG